MEQPPILPVEPAPGQQVGLGRIGMFISLFALLAAGLAMLGGAAPQGKPG